MKKHVRTDVRVRRDEISRARDKRGRKTWKNTKNRVRVNGGLAGITENHPPSRISLVQPRSWLYVFVNPTFYILFDVGNIMDSSDITWLYNMIIIVWTFADATAERIPPNSKALWKVRRLPPTTFLRSRGVLLLLFVRFERRRRNTWCFQVVVSVYGGTTWHRGVRSAAGLPDRVTPNAAPHHYRCCRSGIGGGDCFVVIISYPPRTAHTRVEPDWHHTSTRRLAWVVPTAPPLFRPVRDHEARRSRPATRPPPFVLACPPFDFPLSSRCACACVYGRRRRRTRTCTVRAVGRAASEQRLAVCPFGTPPGGATRRPAPQHHRRACRSVGRSPINQKGRIFSGTPPYYIIYMYIYI